MANSDVYLPASSSDEWTQWNGGGNFQGACLIGNNAGFQNDGAVRFPSVNVNQGVSVVSASLRIHADHQGSGSVSITTYGIKETNTASFSSNPFGRTKTSASTTQLNGMPGIGAFLGINVTSQVNEIIGQGGWSSGNAMGFLCFNNSGTSGTAAFVEDDSLACQLIIQISSTPNFTPTPGTISAPSFPSAQDWGLKVSQPGIDVKTATESQLYFTSRKKELRVGTELATNGGSSSYTHGLGYAPSVLGYYNNSGTTRIMNMPSNVLSVEEYIASDSNNVYYFLNGTAELGYLYVFIDPLT